MPDGSFLTVGGSQLRRLSPGAEKLEVLHRIEGDNLYRVAGTEAGAILAAWEKDPSLHYFHGNPLKHVIIPAPSAPTPEIWEFTVDHLAFLADGDALVHMRGRKKLRGECDVAYRVPVNGGAPTLLYRVDDGHKIEKSRNVAIFVIPEKPDQRCEHGGCAPVREIIAYEVTGKGVKQTLLVEGEGKVGNGRMIWGNTDGRIFMEISLPKNERALLRWRPGDPKPDIRPFVKHSYSETLFATNSGEVLRLVNDSEDELLIQRHLPDGSSQVVRLPKANDADTVDTGLHDLGMRKNGNLWLHWGDHVLLFERDLSKPPRAYDVEPLLTRRTEWADRAVYVKDPEALWIGIEVGKGRDFVRVPFAEMETGAKAWNPPRMAKEAE